MFDEVDSDEDGFIDTDDLGCSAPGDEDERDPPKARRGPYVVMLSITMKTDDRLSG